MASARQQHDWEMAGSIQATIANTVRDQKKRRKPWQAWDFMPEPYAGKARGSAARQRRSRGIPLTADNIHLLKALLPKGKRQGGK